MITKPPTKIPCGVTLSMLEDFLHYDAASGVFTYLQRPLHYFASAAIQKQWNDRYANRRADRPRTSADDYWFIIIMKRKFYAHRVAFFMMTGRWPNEVDHINRVKGDNRWDNLREVTRKQNHMNRGKDRNNTSGFRGVYFDARRKTWYAQMVKPDGSRHVKSGFTNPESAHEHLLEVRKQHHNIYSNAE